MGLGETFANGDEVINQTVSIPAIAMHAKGGRTYITKALGDAVRKLIVVSPDVESRIDAALPHHVDERPGLYPGPYVQANRQVSWETYNILAHHTNQI